MTKCNVNVVHIAMYYFATLCTRRMKIFFHSPLAVLYPLIQVFFFFFFLYVKISPPSGSFFLYTLDKGVVDSYCEKDNELLPDDATFSFTVQSEFRIQTLRGKDSPLILLCWTSEVRLSSLCTYTVKSVRRTHNILL